MIRATRGELMNGTKQLINENRRYAKLRWRGLLGSIALRTLMSFTKQFQFSVANGDLCMSEKVRRHKGSAGQHLL